MQQCNRCSASFADGLRFCPDCGTGVSATVQQTGQQAPKNCINCLEQIPYDAMTCPHCNEKQPGRPAGTSRRGSWINDVSKLWNSKFCVQCNALINNDLPICPHCQAEQNTKPPP